MPLPLDERKKPTDIKVHISTGTGVEITWSDGHASHYGFQYLRDQCPCALCDDQRKKKTALPAAGGPVLPMFKPKAAARAARPVGNYALQIDFSDGHTTGIYSFTYLREICPCPNCAEAFRTNHA